jgi:cytidine deaminase
MAAAVAAGARAFRRLVLVTDGADPIPPCGACREFLAEVAPNLPVVSEAGGKRREWRLGELLPLPFELRTDEAHSRRSDDR